MAEIKITPLTGDETISDFCDRTIIQILTEGGDKCVHYYGYGYQGDDMDKPNDWRFLEYTFLIAPVVDVIAAGGLSEWERKNQEFCKQYITDYTEKRVVEIYKHYDNGNAPIGFLGENEHLDKIPDGCYII